MEVLVQDDQIENAIKALKRQMAKDGILKELKKRRAYEKPSVKRKRKRQEAKRRREKVARRYARKY
ncbi:MAG: 30S ribosomal protein S21 [Thermodesulfobacteriota bacterium]